MIAVENLRGTTPNSDARWKWISSVLAVNGTSTCRETPYDLILRPAILNQRDGNNQATGRMSEHIEAAILLIVRNWYSGSCDTFGISPFRIEEQR